MASRNSKGRMIYWKISYSKQLARCSTLSKLLFTWLIPNSDDLGRMEGDPEVIKGMIFPYDDKISVKHVKESLEELAKEGLIYWKMVGENYYIQFPSFQTYQTLRKDRQYKSDYPDISENARENTLVMTCHDMSGHVGQNLREEKEKRSEGEGEGEVKESIPYLEFQETFNRICTSFPQIKTMSKGRKEKVRIRCLEIKTMETFEQVCTLMENSSFLKGNNKNKWKATFDWLISNDNNWVKVLEGNYDDVPNGQAQPPPQVPRSWNALQEWSDERTDLD